MSFSANYPTSRPALNLNFARSKVLDPRITFTRASTATYYDGVTTAKAEENLILRSQDFTNAVWATNTASVSYTANTTAAPDGTMTADTMTAAVGTGTRFGSGTGIYGITSGLVYTASLFVQAGTDTVVQLLFPTGQFGSDAYANFDLSAGTVGSVGASATATISSAGGTWYRCSITATATASSTASIGMGFVFTGNNSSAARLPSITTAGTETLILWGAQLEQRDAVTSYTATTTQQITNYIPVLLTAATNAPRFDHNPTTGESLGLLIEEQRTNLFTYSADFANAAWSKFRASITSNIIVAPDGTLTGDKLVEDTTATNTHYVSDSVNLIANTSYNATVYVKAAERTRVRLQNSSTPNWTTAGSAYFDLSAGTIVSGTGSITPIGNGWYRCSINGTFGGADAAGGLNIFIVESGTTISYTGDGYSGIYIWGAQLEAAEFPTSYIATGAATATRSADAASMTGTNFSSWYNQGEGTVYFEGGIPYNYSAGFQTPYSVNDTTANNNIQPAFNSSADVFNVEMKVAGSLVAGFYPAYISGTTKLAFAYKLNDVNYAKDGTAGTTDTSATIPVVTQINLGANHTPSNFLNGHIRRISYYPLRLTNAQLQALTS